MSLNILDQIDEPGSPPAASPSRIWSSLQEAIFEALREPENLLVQAVAGSGKTTTLIEAGRRASGSVLNVAFNKAIVEDTKAKGASGDVKTFNALGHRLWMDNAPGAQLNARKTLDLLKKLMGDTTEFKEHGYTLSRLVGLAKNCSFNLHSDCERGDFVDLIDAYGFDVGADQIDRMSTLAMEAFEQSRRDLKTFDFDDQLYMPLQEGWTFGHWDNVLPDEAQDLSPVQHDIVERLAASGAKIIAVGDRHQAIYGFRGASHQSMDILKKKFSMRELPLSISYRCSQLVVAAAQEYCPEIQFRDGAPEGLVEWQEDKRGATGFAADPELFPESLIVCRNNAPLFGAILRHVRARQPCRVLSNFLDSFQGFIRGFKTVYTNDLRTKLARWFEREREAAERKGQRGKLYALRDKFDTVKLLCEDYGRTEDVIEMVKRLGESQTGPTFATIHKAKGLEHERVYILRPDLMPAFYATTEDQIKQENNLTYVAITRAKESLTYGISQR